MIHDEKELFFEIRFSTGVAYSIDLILKTIIDCGELNNEQMYGLTSLISVLRMSLDNAFSNFDKESMKDDEGSV